MAEAQLCRRLSTSDWRCDPVSSPVAPGRLFFYTRVKAAQDTTVEHRWYREDRLRQSAELRIRASPVSRYRTYTRQTVTAENAGNWRVELRTKEGSLLLRRAFRRSLIRQKRVGDHTIVRGHFGQGFSSFNFGIAILPPAFDSPRSISFVDFRPIRPRLDRRLRPGQAKAA